MGLLLEGEGWREQAVTAGLVALPARQPFGLPRAQRAGLDAPTTNPFTTRDLPCSFSDPSRVCFGSAGLRQAPDHRAEGQESDQGNKGQADKPGLG